MEVQALPAKDYVALCAVKRKYLKITACGYYTTTNASDAFRDTQDQVARRIEVLRNAGVQMQEFMIMRSKDASKIVPGLGRPVVELIYSTSIDLSKPIPGKEGASRKLGTALTTKPSESTERLIAAASALSELVSSDRKKELSSQLSALDKRLVDAYHYIEVSNLNAAKGYQAYRALREILVERRKVKNELTVVNRIRQCGVRDMERTKELAVRAWDPCTDILVEKEGEAEVAELS